MNKLKKRYVVLTLSAALLSAYANPITQNNITIVHAQATLPNATYTQATPIEATSFNEALQHFSLYHDAHPSLDFSSIILTEDEADEYGAIYLSEKIDIQQPFSISGKINLGDKITSSHSSRTDIKGGDGISFLFLDAFVGRFGQPGASLGLGRMKNAFGVKLDTHYNQASPSGIPYADSDPALYNPKGKPFGAFITSNSSGNVTTLNSTLLEDKPNDTFVPFTLTYGGKENPTMTMTYGSTTITRNVEALVNKSSEHIRAFGIFASTMDGTNKQSVKIDSLNYTGIRPKVIIQYIDDITGETIQKPKSITGQLNTTKNIVGSVVMVPNYKLVRHNLTTAPGFQSGDTITLLNGTQTVTYAYAPIYSKLYPLVAKDTIQVEQNQPLTPQEVLQNGDTLPNGTTLSWKEPVDTSTIGETSATLIATYPDNTTAELLVNVQVIAAPIVSEEPVSTETPGTSEQPVSTETSKASENPVSTETSKASENPVSTETSNASKNPVSTETSNASENPVSTETSNTSENPVSTETSAKPEKTNSSEIVNKPKTPKSQVNENNSVDTSVTNHVTNNNTTSKKTENKKEKNNPTSNNKQVKKDNKKSTKSLPKTSSIVISFIYPALAFITAGVLMVLARLKKSHK